MLQRVYQAINFRLIKSLSINRMPKSIDKKVIYLTFDDGPEPHITPIILNLLEQYQAKATFFNIGYKNELYPELLKEIINQGHRIGNHTYSHLNGLSVNTKQYLEDVERCRQTYETNLLRPAFGASSISQVLKLKKQYKIVLWNKGSNDHNNDMTDYPKEISRIIQHTQPGDIILFHNKREHEKQTLAILPSYLDFLSKNNYQMIVL